MWFYPFGIFKQKGMHTQPGCKKAWCNLIIISLKNLPGFRLTLAKRLSTYYGLTLKDKGVLLSSNF